MQKTLFVNAAAGVLIAPVGPSDTMMVLTGGQGAGFPAPGADEFFWATITHPESLEVEVVQVSERSADTLTVIRGRDNTTAKAFPAGAVVECRVVAAMLLDLAWRGRSNIPGGPVQLDSTGRLAVWQQHPSTAYVGENGKLPAGVMAEGYAPTSTYDARYGRLAAAANWTAIQYFNAGVGVSDLHASSSVNTPVLRVGDDAYLIDVNIPNVVVLRGGQNSALGYLLFGTSNMGVGWDGSKLCAYAAGTTNEILHRGLFNPDSKVNTTGGNAWDLRVYRSGFSGAAGLIYFGDAGAWLQFDGGNFVASNVMYGPNFVGQSDERLKRNIRAAKVDAHIGDKIELITFEWRTSTERAKLFPKGRRRGVIAQDVEKYAPGRVERDSDGNLAVDYPGLALDAAVGNAARLRKIEAQVESLRAENAALKKTLSRIAKVLGVG